MIGELLIMAIKDSQIYPISNTNNGVISFFINANIVAFNRFKLVGYSGVLLPVTNANIQLRGF